MLSAIRTFVNEIAFCYNVGIRRSRIVEKYKFDENNGLWYKLQGDYYLPCLELPEEEQA